MTTRKRIRVRTPSVSGGGQGGGVVANVVWGPNFGEVEEWKVGVSVSLPEVAATGEHKIGVTTQITKVDVDILTPIRVGVTASLPEVAMDGERKIGVTASLPEVAMDGERKIGVTTSLPEVAMANERKVGVSVSGTASGAPFWQSEAHTALAADATEIVVSKPAGTVEGDLMVAFFGMSAVGGVDINTLAGWTFIRTDVVGAANANRVRSFWKIAGAAEPASYTWTYISPPCEQGTGEIHRIIGTHATTPINVHNGATVLVADLDPDPSAPGVITTVTNCLVMAYLYHDHGAVLQSHTAPASHTERSDYESTNVSKRGATMAEKIFANAAATGTAEFNCTEAAGTDGIMQRIAIAPGVATLA